jgi:hypothetical protein
LFCHFPATKKHLKNKGTKTEEKINLIEKQLEVQSYQLKASISALGNINDQSQVNHMGNIRRWYFECLIVIIKKMEARNESYINDT